MNCSSIVSGHQGLGISASFPGPPSLNTRSTCMQMHRGICLKLRQWYRHASPKLPHYREIILENRIERQPRHRVRSCVTTSLDTNRVHAVRYWANSITALIVVKSKSIPITFFGFKISLYAPIHYLFQEVD
jgi:hypothetical protein